MFNKEAFLAEEKQILELVYDMKKKDGCAYFQCDQPLENHPFHCDLHGPMIDQVKVKKSSIPNAGMGLFVTADLNKEELISLYSGDVLTAKEHCERYPRCNGFYGIQLKAYNMFIDAVDKKSCLARWVNDARDSSRYNCEFRLLKAEQFMHIVLRTTRVVKEGEELFVDYGKDYWENR